MKIEECKGIVSFLPNAFATSTPIAKANNKLLQLPNSSQCHLMNGGCVTADGDRRRRLCELCGGVRVSIFQCYDFEKFSIGEN